MNGILAETALFLKQESIPEDMSYQGWKTVHLNFLLENHGKQHTS